MRSMWVLCVPPTVRSRARFTQILTNKSNGYSNSIVVWFCARSTAAVSNYTHFISVVSFFVLFTLFYYELFQFTVKHAVRSVYGADNNISNWSNWVRMNSNKSWDCRLFSIRYEPNMPSSTLVASFTNANHKQNANSINYLLINSVMRLNFGAKCISLINNML